MKRFAYVCGDAGIPLPGSKGASVHVASVCRELKAAGLEGEVFAVRTKAEALEGLILSRLAVPPAPRGKDESPGEREARLFLAGSSGKIQPAARPDLIYERYSLWHTGGLALARELGVPFVLEVNSPLPDEAAKFRTLSNPDLAEGVARLLLQEADGVVCVSEEVRAWVRERRGKDEGAWLIPNGVDPDLFAPARGGRRPAPLPPRPTPVVAFCGSNRAWHGLGDLLDGFRSLLDARSGDAFLLCVGPARAPFLEAIRTRGLQDQVHVTDFVPQAEVPAWLNAADVAVAPYPVLEHFYYSPLKVFEFLALGLPVVASRVGQIPSLVEDGQRGLLCPPGDAQALAAAMGRLCADPEEAARLGEAGRAWVLEHATWERRVAELLKRVEGLPS